jgi:putative lipoic acid-binding regulatory protein
VTTQDPPKIEFPCPDYPIKVVGEAGANLRDHTIAVFTKHAADFNPEQIKTKASSKGTWQSLTIAIEATGEDQLRAIFEDLKANKAVKMVI